MGKLLRQVLLISLLVTLLGCAPPPGTTIGTDDSAAQWGRTYIDLINKGDVRRLSAHLANQDNDGKDARRRIDILESGRDWQVISINIAKTGISDSERNVFLTLKDKMGQTKEFMIEIFWADDHWNTGRLN